MDRERRLCGGLRALFWGTILWVVGIPSISLGGVETPSSVLGNQLAELAGVGLLLYGLVRIHAEATRPWIQGVLLLSVFAWLADAANRVTEILPTPALLGGDWVGTPYVLLMIGLLPAFCMAMGKLSRDLGLKDVPRSWRRATWFAMAFLLGGASIIALILFSEATGSESSGVGAGTGQDGSAEVRVEEVGGAPVDVELGQNPRAGAGFCILLLIGLFS